uniref:Neurotransmitter-gated ion-channel ligand-binding domain-containing protein n=1 Tax=Strigamia maritima TaxID=126957 RepID=T1JBH7_STRMM
MATALLLVFIFYTCTFETPVAGATLPIGLYELKLRDELFANRASVESHSRPVVTHGERIQVYMQMAINYVIDLDEKSQILIVNSLMSFEWMDSRVRWNPRTFGGLEMIQVPADLLWKPDIIPYNSVNSSGTDFYTNTLLKVHYSGRVMWISPVTTHTTCDVDLTYFPFDQQKCSIVYGSWTYHGWSLLPVLKTTNVFYANKSLLKDAEMVGLQSKEINNEWKVIKANATIIQKYYKCCKEPYPTIFFNLTFNRGHTTYIYTVIIPSVLPVFLFFYTFCLPPTCSDKILVTCFLYLYQILLTLYMYWLIPHNGSGIPKIVAFCAGCTGLISTSLVLFVISFSLTTHRHKSRIPRFFKSLFNSWIIPVLCIRLTRIQVIWALRKEIPQLLIQIVQCSRQEINKIEYVDGYQVNHENRVREILFQRSDAAAQSLPAAQINHPVEVKMALDVTHIISLDEKEQILIFKSVIRMEWDDVGLKWNASEFGNVNKVSISPKWLWTPDISLFTSSNGDETVITGPGLASVSSKGFVTWEPPVTLYQTCNVDIWHYPHDKHTCNLKFGSWTHHGFALQLTTFNTSTAKYLMNEKIAEVNEWAVHISPAEILTTMDPCCPEPFIMLNYKIELARKTAFYHYTLLCPLFAILFMANSLFWLPPNNSEKTSLAATVCLLLVIIICHLLWILPNTTSHVPAILGVCASMLVFATVSLIISIITNNLSKKTSIPPDFIIRSGNSLFCRFLGTNVRTEQTTDSNCQPQEPLSSQWTSIARGIDRICFCAYLIVSLVFIDVCTTMNMNQATYEAKLREDLFTKSKINVLTRPKQTINDTTDVMINLYVYHILGLDSKTEILSVNAWLGHAWQDLNFVWKPDDYGGLRHISAAPDEVWVPDVYLLNGISADEINNKATVPVFISNEGNIWWVPPGTFRSFCSMDLTAYPFDEHTCHLLFISWSVSATSMNLSLMIENYSLTSFMYDEHNEWEIISSHGNRTLYRDASDQVVYIDINYYIQLRRRAPFYQLTLILPTVVAVLITLIAFWVPPSSGHKPFVCGINIIILALLMINLYWTTPRNGSGVPGIVIFCGNAFFFAGFTFLLSIATTNIHKRPPISPPPLWLQKFLFGLLNKVLCVAGQQFSSGDAQLLTNDDEDEDTINANSGSDWQMVAIALDRLGFIVYCLSLFIILLCAFV